MARCKIHGGDLGGDKHCCIFEIGLGRTASRSVCEAFHLLGLNIYHGLGHCGDCQQDAFDKLRVGRFDWDVYKTCDYSGNVSSVHWHQLHKNIPDSRFILTVRPVEDWLDRWEGKLHSHSRRVALSKCVPSLQTWRRLIQFGMVGFDREEWGRRYREHNRQVIDTIEEECLLVLNVWNNTDENVWRRIAKFIGQEPPDILFPKLGRQEHPGKSKRLAEMK